MNLRLQVQQQNIIAIQEVINQKNLQQSQNQVEQAQQQQKTVQNDYIQKNLIAMHSLVSIYYNKQKKRIH